MALHVRGRGTALVTPINQGVKKFVYSRTRWKAIIVAKEGDSPVDEIDKPPEQLPSTAGHVESRGKLGGPSSKAKYYLTTDSEPVP